MRVGPVVRVIFTCLMTLSLGTAQAAAEQPLTGQLGVDGAELYWEQRGEGPPLLLLHGFGESSVVWDPYLDRLEEHFTVVLMDLRGHGRSTNPGGEFAPEQSGRDVVALMDHLGWPRFSAVGVSAGGMTLLHVATAHPDRVDAMVLVGTAPWVPEQARRLIRAFTDDEAATLEYLRRFATRGDEQARMLARQFRGFATTVDDPAFTPPELARIEAPALVVHGDRDEFFPVEMAVEMYRAIPHASLMVVPDGGHEPVYEPQTVPWFLDVLERFLAGDGTR